jgi:hypothetical protein
MNQPRNTGKEVAAKMEPKVVSKATQMASDVAD